jgi:hypothetical protein
MLKVIVTIDCNRCGQPFKRIAISTDRDPMAWRALADDVEYHAGNSGWDSQRSAHYCEYCVHHAVTAGLQAAADGEEEPDL